MGEGREDRNQVKQPCDRIRWTRRQRRSGEKAINKNPRDIGDHRNTSLGFLIRIKKNTIHVDDPSACTEQKTTTTTETTNNLLGGAGKNTQKIKEDLRQNISDWRTIVIILPPLSLCGREWASSCGNVVRVGSGLKCV